jgi:thymidylate kinase
MDIPVSLAYTRMNSEEDRQTAPHYFESQRAWYALLAKTEGFVIIDSSEDFEKTKILILEQTITNLHLEPLRDGGRH